MKNAMKQAHTIEIFSASCPLCKHITDEIEIGKCKGCNQTIYDVNKMTDEVKRKMREYSVTSVPTTIVDHQSGWYSRLSLDMRRRFVSEAEKRTSIEKKLAFQNIVNYNAFFNVSLSIFGLFSTCRPRMQSIPLLLLAFLF